MHKIQVYSGLKVKRGEKDAISIVGWMSERSNANQYCSTMFRWQMDTVENGCVIRCGNACIQRIRLRRVNSIAN